MPETTIIPQREVKLPVDSRIPTLAQIATRMASRFGETAPLVRELVTPCAEEAERIVIEVKELVFQGQVTLVKQQGYRVREGSAMVYRYYCPVCRKQKIRRNYLYCPECGSRIKWLKRGE